MLRNNKHTKKMITTLTENELKLEAHKLKVAFNNKGIKHIWDFVQAFYPNKYDKDKFTLFLAGRQANYEFVEVLTDVLKRLEA